MYLNRQATEKFKSKVDKLTSLGYKEPLNLTANNLRKLLFGKCKPTFRWALAEVQV